MTPFVELCAGAGAGHARLLTRAGSDAHFRPAHLGLLSGSTRARWILDQRCADTVHKTACEVLAMSCRSDSRELETCAGVSTASRPVEPGPAPTQHTQDSSSTLCITAREPRLVCVQTLQVAAWVAKPSLKLCLTFALQCVTNSAVTHKIL